MINHAYTLLRNRQGRGAAATADGAYTPLGYNPVRLTPAAAAVHSILFGVDADETSIAIRLRQYAAILHATELRDDVLAFDPRVTYLDAADSAPPQFGLFVTNGIGSAPLFTAGLLPADSPSQSFYRWEIITLGGSSAGRIRIGRPSLSGFRGRGRPAMAGFGYPPARTVRITSLAKQAGATINIVTVTAGLTAPISLLGTALKARFHSDLVNTGDNWLVTYTAMPSPGIGAVLATLDSAASAAVLALFGDPATGRYAVWKRMWLESLPLPYRLGAVLLALASRTEEIRSGAPRG